MIPQAPYPGLRPFDRDETEIFFGREEQVDELLARLGQHRFLAVVGVSGCGKSSLVRAGVLPILDEFQDEADPPWCIAELRPGNRPIANLAQAVLNSGVLRGNLAATANAEKFLAATLRRGPLGLVEVLDQTRVSPAQKLLILVDQFEEVFRYHRLGALDTAAPFVDLLLESAATPKFSIYVMLTMRSDFLGDCALFPGLPEALNRSQFLTPRLTREQRRAAIAGPAHLFGTEPAPRLVNRVLNDMGDDPDQLPLMQHAMMRVWQLTVHDSDAAAGSARPEASPLLTLAQYDSVGGFDQALSNHANEAYSELSETQQAIAERLFRCLCEKGPGELPIRRPVPLQEIADVAATTVAAVAEVVETFRRPGRSFLTPPNGTPLHPETVIDISHESLIRHWDKMTDWYQAELRAGTDYQRLRDSARRWRAKEADPLSRRELKQALEWRLRETPNPAWAERYGGDLEDVSAFLKVSVRKRRTQRILMAGTVAIALLSLGIVLWSQLQLQVSLEQQKRETDARHAAEAIRLAVQADQARSDNPKRAMLLAVEAVREDKSASQRVVEAEQALRDALGSWSGTDSRVLLGHAGTVNSLAYSPDDKTLASASRDYTIRLWDTESGQLRATLEGHTGSVTAVVYSPDGRTLASGSSDKTIRLRDVDSGNSLHELIGHADYVSSVAFSPDGKTLASGSADQTVHLWDPATGALLRTLVGHIAWVASVAFNPDVKILASGSADQTVRLWDPATGALLRTLEGHNAEVISVVFGPGGKTLASASADKTVRLWDPATGALLRTLEGHTDAVYSVAFKSDGKTLASGSSDKTIRLWDVASGKLLRTLEGSPDRVFTVAFDGYGNLAAGLGDNSIRLWKLGQGRVTKTSVILDHYKAPILIAAPAPGTTDLITVSRRAIHHNPGAMGNDQAYGIPVDTLCEEIGQAAVSPDGDQVLMICKVRNRASTRAIYEENVVFLLDMTTDAPPQELPLKIADNRDITVTALAVDAAGRWAYIGDRQGRLKRWDLHQTTPMGQLVQDRRSAADKPPKDTSSNQQPKIALTALALNPDGSHLLVGDEAGVLQMWSLKDEATPNLVQTLRTEGAPINMVRFDRDGKLILCADRGRIIQVWRTDDFSAPWRTLVGHVAAVNAVALSDDGGLLISGSDDRTARLWDLSDPETSYSAIVLRGHNGAVTTVGFDPEGNWLISGSNDNTVRLWTRRVDDLEQQAKDTVGRNLTGKEWKQYFRGKDCRKTFSHFPSGCGG